MTQTNQGMAFTGPGMMLLSAAVFGYFGFGVTWLTTGNSGQFLLYVALLEWTLKISSICFVVAAVVAFGNIKVGNLLYAVIGLLGGVSLAVVFVMDFMDKQHMAMSPILLIIFVLWNGYGSWMGLRDVMAARNNGHARNTRA